MRQILLFFWGANACIFPYKFNGINFHAENQYPIYTVPDALQLSMLVFCLCLISSGKCDAVVKSSHVSLYAWRMLVKNLFKCLTILYIHISCVHFCSKMNTRMARLLCNFLRISCRLSLFTYGLSYRQTIWCTIYWYAATCQSIKLTECLYWISRVNICTMDFFFKMKWNPGRRCYCCFFHIFSKKSKIRRDFYAVDIVCRPNVIFWFVCSSYL